MGVADSIFEPHPPDFGKILIFSRCSNDSKTIFWYFQQYKKCQKSVRAINPVNTEIHDLSKTSLDFQYPLFKKITAYVWAICVPTLPCDLFVWWNVEVSVNNWLFEGDLWSMLSLLLLFRFTIYSLWLQIKFSILDTSGNKSVPPEGKTDWGGYRWDHTWNCR